MRIVWADEEAVPARWTLEISLDGSEWSPWITQENTQTDGFDKWPGFEKYTPDEEPARYLRYTQRGPDGGESVRLRQLSVYR
jgi:hypothetical protein